MDVNDRVEFERHFSILCAAFDVPCTPDRQEAYWTSLARMSILTFARTVERILTEEDWTRIPKPSQVWGSSKRLRAAAPEEPRDDGFRGDTWDAVANRHLLALILRSWQRGKHYSAEETATLVRQKNSWAADMRDLANESQVHVDLQRKVWNDYMGASECAPR